MLRALTRCQARRRSGSDQRPTPAPATTQRRRTKLRSRDAPAPAQQPAPSLEKPGTAPETDDAAKPAAKTPPKKSTNARPPVRKPPSTTKEGEKIPEGTNSKDRRRNHRPREQRNHHALRTRQSQANRRRKKSKKIARAIALPKSKSSTSKSTRRTLCSDLIDQSLLVQRGKDMGLNVETDVIKRLDPIRIQNNLSSMEDLEKAVTSHGINWEDFKDNIRKSILTQKVISQEVGSHVNIGKEDVRKILRRAQKRICPPRAGRSARDRSQHGREEGLRASRPEEKSRNRS